MILHIKNNANKKALTLAKCLNLFNIIPSIIKIGARISIVVAVISTMRLNQNGR